MDAYTDAKNRVEWIEKRIILDVAVKAFVEFQLQEAFKAGVKTNEAIYAKKQTIEKKN